MITLMLVVVIIAVIIIGFLIGEIQKPFNFPPGPSWYPFLGCSNVVRCLSVKHGCQWKGLQALANQYSTKALGLKLAGELTVVVFGDRNIRQVFIGSEFEGRPDSFFLRLRCFGKRIGITSADGPLWKEHRKFTVKQLRNVGFGKTEMEKEIQTEMNGIIKIIKDHNGQPFTPRSMLASAVMNVLWKYAAGERIKEDRLGLLLDLLSQRSKAFTIAGGWLNQFPWCRFIVPQLSGYSLIKNINGQLSAIIDEAIQKHKNGDINGTDFIYYFLKEMEVKTDTFTDDQLRVICLDLLIAGSQTTSNTLEFALLAVLRNPSLQDTIYEEINTTLGMATPSWTECSRLVYTSAFLLEVQRYYTIVPLAGPRRVVCDTTIDGYSIPKGTTILLALADLHSDPTLWENPTEFKPERFIDSQGKLKTLEYFFPFGLGRRRCPGDSLAKSFIFLVFMGIMQNFKIIQCNGTLPSDEPIAGILSAPKPYKIQFVSRH